MPATKSLTETVEKWRSRSAAASADYATGINRSGVDWAGPTIAAAPAYASGVQDAIGRGAFEKGVAAATNARWKERASTLGAQRFAGGVSASTDRYSAGVGKFLEVIRGINLPPRGPRGSASNFQRVQLIGDALHQARISG